MDEAAEQRRICNLAGGLGAVTRADIIERQRLQARLAAPREPTSMQ